jgi:phage terminase large subunit
MSKSIIDVFTIDVDIDNKEPAPFDIPHAQAVLQPAAIKQVKNLERLQHCPRCTKPLLPAQAISGSESTTFKECPECGTLINTFRPTHYQARFLKRRERYKMSAGGYGTGKSRTNIEDVIKHVMLIPNAVVVVAGRTYPALESTFIREFYSMFPNKLVRRKNDQKHELYLTNGSIIMFRSFDDPTKMKSINATKVVIVEASDVPYSGFTMMQSRIRNTNAMIPEYDMNGDIVQVYDEMSNTYRTVYKYDARHICLETNPDSGWVKTNFLLEADTVEFFGDAYNEGYRFAEARDTNKYVQVVSTSANPYLPETYEQEQTRGKSQAYIQQFYKGSFNFSSNLVFPNVGVCIKAPHPLPEGFDDYGRRTLYYLVGLDYGINDPTHVVFAAFSTVTKKLYVYDELRLNNSDVRTIAKEYRKQIRMNGTDLDGLLMMPRFDGRSYNKRESDLVSIGGMFEAEGLFFEPSFTSHEARIIKLNALINHNQIEIFATCDFMIEELLNYKFKVDRNGIVTNKPEDGRDHGITALEFIVVELPHNLQEVRLSSYIPNGTEFVHDKHMVYHEPEPQYYYDPLKEDYNDKSTDYYRNRITAAGNHPNGVTDNIYAEVVSARGSVADNEDEEDEDAYGNYTLGAYIPGK